MSHSPTWGYVPACPDGAPCLPACPVVSLPTPPTRCPDIGAPRRRDHPLERSRHAVRYPLRVRARARRQRATQQRQQRQQRQQHAHCAHVRGSRPVCCTLGARAIGGAHADVAVAFSGASSCSSSEASNTAPALQRQQLLLLQLLGHHHVDQQQPRARTVAAVTSAGTPTTRPPPAAAGSHRLRAGGRSGGEGGAAVATHQALCQVSAT